MKGLCLPLLCLSLLCVTESQADVLWQPVGVQTDMGEINSNFLLPQLVSQGGLSSTYVSGVTDAATYSATHDEIFDEWQSAVGVTSGVVSFDLGQQVALTELRLWQSTWTTSGDVDVQNFNLFADNDIDFGNGTSGLLGTFTAVQSNGAHPMQTFAFPGATTQFVHLQILTNYGGVASGLSEVAFVGSAVPEPSTAVLLIAGGAGLVLRRRSR